MPTWDQAAAEYGVHFTGVDVIQCLGCGGSGYDPTTAEVDVHTCELCEGSGCVRESDLPRAWDL